MLVSVALFGSACSSDQDVASTNAASERSSSTVAGQSTVTNSPQAATTTSTAVKVGASYAVAGEVSTVSEAFCAGLSTTLADAWGPDTVSDVFNEPMPYGACVAEELAATIGVPDDMALHDAFANGCALALVATLDPSMSLGAESDLEISWAACAQQFSELDWGPDDYRITVDGVCYIGFGPNAGVTGCQDTTGGYITTTTFAYTASDNFSEFLDFAGAGPEVLSLSRDAAVAAAVAQRWCASSVDYGTGDLAEWVTDLSEGGSGRYGYTDEEFADVAAFLPLLAESAVSVLCPEVADEFRSNVDAFSRGEWPFMIRSELDGLGRVFMSWEGTAMQEYSDLFRDYRELVPEHWTDVGFAICTELDQGIDPSDRFLSLDAWLDAGAAPTDSLIDAADALHNAAIEGMCPRHSRYYWSIAESGVPWWDIPSN